MPPEPLAGLVTALLDFDLDTIDRAVERYTDLQFGSALSGTFATAVSRVAPRLPEEDRHRLYRRAATMSAGQAQGWMVEAAFRSAETDDPDLISGADGEGIAAAMLNCLRLLSSDHLTTEDKRDLRPIALARAQQVQSAISAEQSQTGIE